MKGSLLSKVSVMVALLCLAQTVPEAHAAKKKKKGKPAAAASKDPSKETPKDSGEGPKEGASTGPSAGTSSENPPAPKADAADPLAAIPQALKDEAKSRFQRGLELYQEGEYKLALIEFERAYGAVPNYKVLYNVGLVRQQLSQYAKALEALEQYMKEGGERISPPRRAEVNEALTKLRTVLTAQLTIKVQPEDAEVLLDDVPFVKSDTGSSRVDAGDHKIVVSKRGFFPATRMLRMAGGDSQTVEVALEAEPVKPAAVASPVIIRQEATPGIRTPVLVSWAGAGVLAATTGVFGVLALGQSSKLEDLKNDPASLKDERDTAVSRGKTYALLTDVSGVLTLAAVGVASYITFKPAKTEKKPNAPVVVTAGLDRVGVTIPF